MKNWRTKVFVVGLILNLIWEFAHAPLYEMGGREMVRSDWQPLVLASLMDAFYILIILSIFSHKNKWMHIGFTGLLVAICIELIALATNVWQYSSLMPVLPVLEVGLSPIFQLATTSLLTLWICGDRPK